VLQKSCRQSRPQTLGAQPWYFDKSVFFRHWLIERARPAVAATDGEQPSGIIAGDDTVVAAAR